MALEINDLIIDIDRKAQAPILGGGKSKTKPGPQPGGTKSSGNSGSDSDGKSGGVIMPADIFGSAGCVPEMDDPFGW